MSSTRPLVRALVAAVPVLAMLWAASPSAGQLEPILGTTTTAPPPTSPPSSSTTSSTPTTVAPEVTTTTAPRSTSTTTTTVPQQIAPLPEVPAEPIPSGDGAPPLEESLDPAGPHPVPDWAREQIGSVPRSSASNTQRVLDLLAPLQDFGFTPEETALVGLGRFPVRGYASFVDDWWFPRFTPSFHLHQGTDVFADFGTPITAPFDGVLTMGEGTSGGIYTYLTLPDGTYYYFAHLLRLPNLPDEQRITDPAEVTAYTTRPHDQPLAYRVQEGTVIGWVGDSGNAKGGAPHLHFEYHPQGGEPVNPKPLLDEWLAEAEADAPQVVALYSRRGPKAIVATQRTRAGGPGPFSAPSRPLAAELLGVSSFGPGTGVQLVADEVTRAVSRIEWGRRELRLDRPLTEMARFLEEAVEAFGSRI